MSNMSYCRFQNTLNDLRDCSQHLEDKLTGGELFARRNLLQLMADMLNEVGTSVDDAEVEGSIQTIENIDHDAEDDSDD